MKKYGQEGGFKYLKKKRYAMEEPPNPNTLLYTVFIFSLIAYFLLQPKNLFFALLGLIAIPSIIGILLILFYVPYKIIAALLTGTVCNLYIKRSKIPINKPEETVIITGKCQYGTRRFCFDSPLWKVNLALLIKYLKKKGKKFSIYRDIDIKTFDKIMANKKVKTVYLLGRGYRHGFIIDSKTIIDYCRYDNPKYKKEFVYQLHSNHGGGKSLVEYVVPKENWKECFPEYGYLDNFSISKMIVDKLIDCYDSEGLKMNLIKTWYRLIPDLAVFVPFVLWMVIFFSGLL